MELERIVLTVRGAIKCRLLVTPSGLSVENEGESGGFEAGESFNPTRHRGRVSHRLLIERKKHPKKLGHQAPGYKVARKAIDQFIRDLLMSDQSPP